MYKFLYGAYMSLIASTAIAIIALTMFYAPLRFHIARQALNVALERDRAIQYSLLQKNLMAQAETEIEYDCIPQNIEGVGVGGLKGVDVPRISKALRLEYENARSSQYTTTLDENKILKADKIIISGTALKDFNYLDCDFDWLKKFNKPVLGICAGMQIIGKMFECELKEGVNIGVRKVRVVKENKLISEDANAYFLHTKIIEGGNFDVVGLCGEMPAIIKHKSKEIYGCIFHAEVLNSEIIKNFVHE